MPKLDIRVLAPTVPASLCRGIPLVDDDVVFALLSELVLKESTEHPESVVRNGFPKMECLRHSSQIDVFYTYSIIGIGYLPAELMAKVQSLIGDSSGKTADSCFLFEVSVGPFLAMGQLPLFLGEPFFRLPIPVHDTGIIAVRIDVESRAAVIKSKRCFFRRQRRRFDDGIR